MNFLPTPFDCCTCGTSSTTGTGTSSGQVYTGSYQDPNGNVTPDDPDIAAFYYYDGEAIYSWKWSVGDQVWYPFITT